MIYQTPWGDWAFAAAGIISDGYVSKPEAIRARDARIDLLDSDQKRYHAAWMAAEEDKEEQAARIKELEAEVEAKNKQIKELQDIIDKPPEEAQWMTDYHLLQSGLDGPIIESARRWHGAFRKAQNSNLIRLQQNARLGAEVERLRSQSVEQVFRQKNEEIAAKDARIKELESEITAWIADRDSWIGRYEAVRKEKDARIADQEAYIERLEAAFLEAKRGAIYFQDAPNTRMMLVDLWDVADKKAREALERIKEGKG